MTNFDIFAVDPQFESFASVAVSAERILHIDPSACVLNCRRAMEFAVKWMYSVDKALVMPYQDSLVSLMNTEDFRDIVGADIWRRMDLIRRMGNNAAHTGKKITEEQAALCLENLYVFLDFVAYCYGENYTEGHFDRSLLTQPAEAPAVPSQTIPDVDFAALMAENAALKEELTARRAEQQQTYVPKPLDLSEYKTRKLYIDTMLTDAGWTEGKDWLNEVELPGMPNKSEVGYADYVLYGDDSRPLAVVEAKRTCVDVAKGRQQAKLYADLLEKKYHRRPVIFLTNGFETRITDNIYPERKCAAIYSKRDLEKLFNLQTMRTSLKNVMVDRKIAGRYYQEGAIKAACDAFARNRRKALLVMATGSGKTRTVIALCDVLLQHGWVKNILFLADRNSLVTQAKRSFVNLLPDLSVTNLCEEKDNYTAHCVFSTYQTMYNVIDSVQDEDGKLFTCGHFDLVICDEAHRSVYNKYRDIFNYFDAPLVGLTATPKDEIDKNTYEIFELENGVPTYVYDYDTAVHQDHVLVPYYNYEVTTKFLSEGITYEELSDEDKERYEDDFTEDGAMPDSIPSQALNDFVFNQKTVDLVLQDLMERGIMVNGGERIGKTIIFAQNKRHAEFILERFNKLYPQYHGTWASRVVCDDSYAQTVIDNFKEAEKTPYIVVSVDMMDTGIDVPACVNLVFFKKVRSKTKFWQMIGRGTRLCPELTCTDLIEREEYTGKKRFLIFDYCGNFEYFRQVKHTTEGEVPISLSENIFRKCVRLVAAFQDASKFDGAYQPWRRELTELCQGRIAGLNTDLFHVRLALKHVEKFKKPEAFICLSELDQQELTEHIAPLVHFDEADAMALRFDNFIYGFILNVLDESPLVKRDMARLVTTARLLEKKSSIPQVAAKLPLLRQISDPELWKDIDICKLEDIRRELRALIRFLDEGSKRKDIITILTDPILDSTAGIPLPEEDPFESYKMKVNRYIEEHKNSLAIYNLTHNISLTRKDYEELERVFTQELGSKEDYVKTFGDTPFGLLIRKIAKLDHEAVLAAFSEFINDQSLNSRQIAFVQKVITHIEQNGYIEDISVLTKAPFDKPAKLLDFDEIRQRRLLAVIKSVRDNALVI